MDEFVMVEYPTACTAPGWAQDAFIRGDRDRPGEDDTPTPCEAPLWARIEYAAHQAARRVAHSCVEAVLAGA